MRNKLFALIGVLSLFASPSLAASGITQITVLDSGGTSRTINVYSNTGAVTGQLMWNNVLCDPTTFTQCQTVNASGQALSLEGNSAAILSAVQAAIPAGANIIGKVGVDQTTPGTTNAVTLTPQAASGLTTFFLQPAGTNNSTSIKASAGNVYYVLAMNNSATVNYLRFYNTAVAPTCTSATGLITQMQIPASTSVGGVSIPLPYPINFSTGIGICLTSGYATTDNTNATASAMSLTIGYN